MIAINLNEIKITFLIKFKLMSTSFLKVFFYSTNPCDTSILSMRMSDCSSKKIRSVDPRGF